MKKLLSALLVFCMLFLTCMNLVSCSSASDNQIDTEETSVVRTTIAKEEWLETWEAGNFSVLSNYTFPIYPELTIGKDGVIGCTTGAEILKFAGWSASFEYFAKDGKTPDSSFVTITDSEYHSIGKTDEGYIADRVDILDVPYLSSLENLGQFFLLEFVNVFGEDCSYVQWEALWTYIYDRLIYIEECKTYRTLFYREVNDFEKSLQIEVECENGKIKELRLCFLHGVYYPHPGLFTFYDFGTTVVELPEYTFAE